MLRLYHYYEVALSCKESSFVSVISARDSIIEALNGECCLGIEEAVRLQEQIDVSNFIIPSFYKLESVSNSKICSKCVPGRSGRSGGKTGTTNRVVKFCHNG